VFSRLAVRDEELGFDHQKMVRGGCESIGESVFHVLRLHVLPHPYFYNYIFYRAFQVMGGAGSFRS